MIIKGYKIEPQAHLIAADLRRANLSGANLSRANLRYADLRGANLSGAYLSGANLSGANLISANLSGARLRYADLRYANMRRANLEEATLPDFQIPQEGELIVWKKLRQGLCKLRIPPEARRTASLIGRKCRAEFAEVLEGSGVDMQTGELAYIDGCVVRPDKYDDDIRVECTNGIHFFLTKQEAENWV